MFLACLRGRPGGALQWASQRSRRLARGAFRTGTAPRALTDDTIFAVSSGQGVVAGVTVLRISGPLAGEALLRLTSSSKAGLPEPRRAALRRLSFPEGKHPESGEELDQALVLWFPEPRSFTGQDVVELHCHGSRAVVSGVLRALEHVSSALAADGLDGAGAGLLRMAEPGEFTRQAFLNGRMDLAQVEGLSDLLAADTSRQRKQALAQMRGALSTKYAAWRAEMSRCLAHTEAVLDFGDDEDDVVEEQVYGDLVPRVRALRDELWAALEDGHRGEIVRDGAVMCIIGAPNAGKSSLLNELARRPAAIVSPVAGTTRDIVEVVLDLGGISVTIADTAGLRGVGEQAASADVDPIEAEGMKRALSRIEDAQIVVVVLDVTDKESSMAALSAFAASPALDADAFQVASDALRRLQSERRKVVVIANKVDLLGADGSATMASMQEQLPAWVRGLEEATAISAIPLSCADGFGISDVENGLVASVQWLVKNKDGDEAAEVSMITRARHRGHVTRCAKHLDAFLSKDLPLDLAAEELRAATLELGRVTGAVDVEDLLDVIFRDFCIGK
eukprot:scaffold2041_cov251-Pinguiococcus_pyrenoidosus.AAC.13